MSKISQYQTVTPVAGDKIVITQVNGSPTNATKNVTVESIAALATQLSSGYTVMNGMINNLGSQSATPIGYDFMQWVSNVTPDTQIPLIRTLRKYQLMQVVMIKKAWPQPKPIQRCPLRFRFQSSRLNRSRCGMSSICRVQPKPGRMSRWRPTPPAALSGWVRARVKK